MGERRLRKMGKWPSQIQLDAVRMWVEDAMTQMYESFDIDLLEPEERLMLLELLVLRTAQDEQLEIPEWHTEILKVRNERFQREGSNGRPWDEVKQNLLKRLK